MREHDATSARLDLTEVVPADLVRPSSLPRCVVNWVLFPLGFLCFPLWPLVVSTQTGDWGYCRHYFRTIARSFINILCMFKSRAFSHYLFLSGAHADRQLGRRRGSCVRCGNCCKKLRCVGLGREESTGELYCKAYGSPFWRYGNCGLFPLDQADVASYGCLGFVFEAKSRPAPRSALQSSAEDERHGSGTHGRAP